MKTERPRHLISPLARTLRTSWSASYHGSIVRFAEIDLGFVPRANLVGRAEILFFSSNGAAEWWQVWKWPFAIRYRRLFNTVD